jgi:energy-coupling factor transport system ATP-binding protein
VLQATSVHYHYPGAEDRPILTGIDLAVERGEWVAVMGPNGSGKSTLLQLLAGIRAPIDGRVRIDRADLSEIHSRSEIARLVGIVFQDPEAQLVSTTVEREIAFGLEHTGVPRTDMKHRINTTMQQFDLISLKHRPPQSLSGGQKQRLALASVLAMKPAVLLLDEPTALLDAGVGEALLTMLESFRADGSVAMLMVTARPEEALRADRIAVLKEGRFAAVETPRLLFSQENRCSELGIARPPAARMSSSIERRGVRIPGSPMTAGEFALAWADASSGFPPGGEPRE